MGYPMAFPLHFLGISISISVSFRRPIMTSLVNANEKSWVAIVTVKKDWRNHMTLIILKYRSTMIYYTNKYKCQYIYINIC